MKQVYACVEKIEFGISSEGDLLMVTYFEHSEELIAVDCGGMRLEVSKIAKAGFVDIGNSTIACLTFDDKNEVENAKYQAGVSTAIPHNCPVCDSPLVEQISEDTTSIRCTNYFGCLGLSVSPIFRLATVALKEQGLTAHVSRIQDFVANFPEGRLEYIYDLKMLMTVDPNTEFRQKTWNNEGCWEVEKAIWNFLKQKSIRYVHFWYVGFNATITDLSPLSIEEVNDSGRTLLIDHPEHISSLVDFFNHWVPEKEYVG